MIFKYFFIKNKKDIIQNSGFCVCDGIHSANQEEFTFFLNYDTNFERVFLDQYGALLNSEQSQFIQS